ncbi:SapC family protein [Novosphingobium sp. KACC 22771]|uniref:SapC family protein n=1 Tax=Novosphingobium sp. KACC 22771 TaxID=3025670 RepID=UPI00236521C7|nr:SapC family protein [Novosphingobium sp. KACC 22771]WDF74964.1 SapC family protein [Novosphingobium sp. KACC 22771]
MANFVPLDFAEHRSLRLATGYSASLGDGLGMVGAVPTEIAALANSYPLFFRRSPVTGAYELGVMLGFAAEENLFLVDEGWDAAYVPLVRRCEPFAVQQSPADPGRNTLMIDLDSPRLAQSGGDVLFFSDGRPSERLQAIVDALEALVKGAQQGSDYAAALDALGLIEPVDVRIDLGGGVSHNPSGLFAIAETRLAQLPADALADLHRRGYLGWAYQQAASVGQIANLILRKNRAPHVR